MRLWLSRRPNGTYLLTRFRPIRRKVVGTGQADLYLKPGEPIGVRDLCPGGVKSLFGVELQPLESVSVRLEGAVADDGT